MTPLTFPHIDPIIFSLGPLHVRWYGLMYVFGFIGSYFLVQKQIRETNFTSLAAQFENLMMLLLVSLIVGARLGYVLFYNFSYYLHNLSEIPATWGGGMSFHGACFTLIVVGWLFCKIKKIDFWSAADIVTITIPIGLGFGRIGNFINGELFGRVTDVPWGIVFPGGGPLPRHPSQLYESFLEGVVLFTFLWTLRKKPWQYNKYWPHGTLLALFLAGYGCIRIFVENFREPDPQLGFLFSQVTMGQLLSTTMVVGSVLIWFYRVFSQKKMSTP